MKTEQESSALSHVAIWQCTWLSNLRTDKLPHTSWTQIVESGLDNFKQHKDPLRVHTTLMLITNQPLDVHVMFSMQRSKGQSVLANCHESNFHLLSSTAGYEVEVFKRVAIIVGLRPDQYNFFCMQYADLVTDMVDPNGVCDITAAGYTVRTSKLMFVWVAMLV